MQKINLNEIEKKAWTSYFKDGLYEIVMAHILLVGMLSSTLTEFGVADIIRISIYIPIMFLGVFFVYFGKKYITTPRLGKVKFKSDRRKNISKLRIAIFTFVILSISIAIAAMTDNLNKSLPMSIIVPSLMFLFFAVAAYYQDYPRFLISGFVFALSEIIYIYVESKGIITGRGVLSYGIPGVCILILGLYSLYKFLKKYPKPESEVPHANIN